MGFSSEVCNKGSVRTVVQDTSAYLERFRGQFQPTTHQYHDLVNLVLGFMLRTRHAHTHTHTRTLSLSLSLNLALSHLHRRYVAR